MNREKMNLKTDDYLDLYLFAGKLNEKGWQQEILTQLRDNFYVNLHKKSKKVSHTYQDNKDGLIFPFGWI